MIDELDLLIDAKMADELDAEVRLVQSLTWYGTNHFGGSKHEHDHFGP